MEIRNACSFDSAPRYEMNLPVAIPRAVPATVSESQCWLSCTRACAVSAPSEYAAIRQDHSPSGLLSAKACARRTPRPCGLTGRSLLPGTRRFGRWCRWVAPSERVLQSEDAPDASNTLPSCHGWSNEPSDLVTRPRPRSPDHREHGHRVTQRVWIALPALGSGRAKCCCTRESNYTRPQ